MATVGRAFVADLPGVISDAAMLKLHNLGKTSEMCDVHMDSKCSIASPSSMRSLGLLGITRDTSGRFYRDGA